MAETPDPTLAAAAERVRIYKSQPSDEAGATWEQDGYIFGRARVMEDILLLANAYLAEHPTDGGELITSKWLDKLLGHPQFAWADKTHVWILPLGSAMRTMCVVRDGKGFAVSIGGDAIALLTTRGDLRRLARALGLPLNEGGTT